MSYGIVKKYRKQYIAGQGKGVPESSGTENFKTNMAFFLKYKFIPDSRKCIKPPFFNWDISKF